MADKTPKRIQRKRTKGWRMPEGAVYVGRPTKWGNPWRLTEVSRAHGVGCFRRMLAGTVPRGSYPTVEEIKLALRGKDLACWCPLGRACHADILLEIANRGTDGR